MTLMGAQFGADVKRLVLVHSVRIVIVVTAVPFMVSFIAKVDLSRPALMHVAASGWSDWAILAACVGVGYLLGRRLRSWGGVLLVPMFVSALAHLTGLTAATPPGWLVAAMQVVIGCITGARFAGSLCS